MTQGERIKHLRKLKGMTLEQLGDAVGVGKSTVRKWENDEIKQIGSGNLARLSIVLKCTTDYLSGKNNTPGLTFDVALTSEEQNIIIEYREVDDAAKIAVKRLLAYSLDLKEQQAKAECKKNKGEVG